ncbi:MAG: hypothetical protein ACOX4E_03975 [Anaerovoracaceae bacterium]
MKKRLMALLAACAVAVTLGSCGGDDPGNNGTPKPNDEKSTATIEVFVATDELLSRYDSFYEYTENEIGELLLLTTDAAVQDFAFISVTYEEIEGELIMTDGGPFFHIGELTPEKPFVVRMLPVGALPAHGVSYVDVDGTEKQMAIYQSGQDPDEAPPYYLVEFGN